MRSRASKNAVAAVSAGLAICLIAWLGLGRWMPWQDYNLEARPAFDALLGGHLLQFLQIAPGYGGSLLMRAPFVLIGRLAGGGALAIERAAAAPCLLASAVFAVWLLARMRALGRGRTAMALAVFLCAANPITLVAVWQGHPEDLLGAVLCVAAVLLAMDGRPVLSGVLLGLAIANKEWALLATGPVLLALPDRRPRALLSAVAVAAVFTVPFVLAGGGFVTSVKSAAVNVGGIFQPWQVWWFFGSHAHAVKGACCSVKAGYRTSPGWVETIAHPLIVALTVPLTLLCGLLRRRGCRRPRHDALLLLVLLLLLRCLLDPWDTLYYSLPFLLALLAWETLTFARPPWVALAAPFVAWFIYDEAVPYSLSRGLQAETFLVVAIPALITIAVALYVPGLTTQIAARARRGVRPDIRPRGARPADSAG